MEIATSSSSTPVITRNSLVPQSISSFSLRHNNVSSSVLTYVLSDELYSSIIGKSLRTNILKSSVQSLNNTSSSASTRLDKFNTSSSTSENTEVSQMVVTKTITDTSYSTNTHYITLFTGSQTILSSIEDVQSQMVTTTATETVRDSVTLNPIDTSIIEEIYSRKISSIVASETLPKELLETTYPKLMSSFQTYVTNYTYNTTLQSETNTIVSSKEDVTTSYTTVFVPEKSPVGSTRASLNNSSLSYTTTTDYSAYTLFTTLFDDASQVIITNHQVVPQVTTPSIILYSEVYPNPEILHYSESVFTLFSTYTYYTTFVSDISSSSSLITQFVTIHPTTTKTIESKLSKTPSLTIKDTIYTLLESLEPTTVLENSLLSVYSTANQDNILDKPIVSISNRSDTEEYEETVSRNKIISSVLATGDLETLVSIVTIMPKADLSYKTAQAAASISAVRDIESSLSMVEGSSSKIQIRSSGMMAEKNQTVTPIDEGGETMLTSSLVSLETKEIHKYFAPIALNKNSKDGEVKATETITNTSSNTPSLVSGTSTTVIDGSTVVFFTDFILSDPIKSKSVKSTRTVFSKESYFSYETPINISKYSEDENGSPLKSLKNAENATHVTINATDELMIRSSELVLSSSIANEKYKLNGTVNSEEENIQSGSVIDLKDLLEGNVNIGGNFVEAVKGILNMINITKNDKNDAKGILPNLTSERRFQGMFVDNKTKPTGRSLDISNDQVMRLYNVQSSEILTHKKKSNSFQETRKFIDTETILEPTLSSESGNEDTLELKGSIQTTSGEISSGTVTPGIGVEGVSLIITGFKPIFVNTPTELSQYSSGTEASYISQTKLGSSVTLKISAESDRNIGEVPFKSEATILESDLNPLFRNNDTKFIPGEQITISKPVTNANMILFPLSGQENQEEKSPKNEDNSSYVNTRTRYITSLESTTRTLTLTTTKLYYTRDGPLTIASIFTTTIAPRTFVSTIIGSKTILGTLPEPTQPVKLEKTVLPTESTTTVTTTTLVFNSITTTIVRTLILRTENVKPTEIFKTSSPTTLVDNPNAGVNIRLFPVNKATPVRNTSFKERLPAIPKIKTESPKTTTRKPFLLFKPKHRLTVPTSPNPKVIGPIPKLRFPTRPSIPPPTTPSSPEPTILSEKDSEDKTDQELCIPECDFMNNELCKMSPDGLSCVCRPGYARTENSTKCEEVKTFLLVLRIAKMKESVLAYKNEFSNSFSPEFKELAVLAKKGIHQAYEDSEVKQNYVTAEVNTINKVKTENSSNEIDEGVSVNFTLHVKRNSLVNEESLMEELSRSILASNYSIGNTELYVSSLRRSVESVQDFNECIEDYNDCASTAICINQPGTYTCKCKDGYEDLSHKVPGRVCSGEIKNCEFCNNRGDCIMTNEGTRMCRCHRMYIGSTCEINGIILAIALPITAVLIILFSSILFYCSRRWHHRRQQKSKCNAIIRTMGMNSTIPTESIIDQKAIILDSSSDFDFDHGIRHPYVFDGPYQPEDNTLSRRGSKNSELSFNHSWSADFNLPPVVIPRVRHHHSKQMNKEIYQGQMFDW
ncbi:uncharacterized protein LOC143255318 [Tachypleus tridentatus]|uniref:uncharacterized protein LOC143255318 n=1 Tax=Tachypleus tridentatus TaxID=6853 RepID=UPI003FD5B56E